MYLRVTNISHMKIRIDLNFVEGVCIFTSFYFPDSELYPLKGRGFDFYF